MSAKVATIGRGKDWRENEPSSPENAGCVPKVLGPRATTPSNGMKGNRKLSFLASYIIRARLADQCHRREVRLAESG